MLFAAEEYIIVKETMFADFQHGGQGPEVVISHRLIYGTKLDRVETYFTAPAHEKSDDVCQQCATTGDASN